MVVWCGLGLFGGDVVGGGAVWWWCGEGLFGGDVVGGGAVWWWCGVGRGCLVVVW